MLHGMLIRRAFEPLVEEGYVRFAYGGGKEGAFLCNHPKVTPDGCRRACSHYLAPHCLRLLDGCTVIVGRSRPGNRLAGSVTPCRWAASC